jgi:delta 1-pyrroline-5-carboxylate dehydrogenase
MAEVKKREFKVKTADGKETALTTRHPTNREAQEGDFEYSKAFNKAIMAGLSTNARLAAILRDSGVWGADKDEAIEAQRAKVADIEEKLAAAPAEGKKAIAEALSAERDILYTMRQERNEIFSHTTESKAEAAQRDYIISKVTERADAGTPVWRKFADFVDEVDGGLVFRATYEYLTFSSGMEANFTDTLPEKAYLKETPPVEPAAEAPAAQAEPQKAEASLTATVEAKP